MLVPQLLLETLEDLSKDDFDKFKWYLGLNILKNCEQIPLYQLGSPFRHNIVSKMIERNGEEKAVNSTVAILKMMKHNSAAERLKKTYTEGAAAQEKVSLAVGTSSSSALCLPTGRRSFIDGAAGAIPSNGTMIISGNVRGNIGHHSGNMIISGNVRGNIGCNAGGIVGNNNVFVTSPAVYHHHYYN